MHLPEDFHSRIAVETSRGTLFFLERFQRCFDNFQAIIWHFLRSVVLEQEIMVAVVVVVLFFCFLKSVLQHYGFFDKCIYSTWLFFHFWTFFYNSTNSWLLSCQILVNRSLSRTPVRVCHNELQPKKLWCLLRSVSCSADGWYWKGARLGISSPTMYMLAFVKCWPLSVSRL